MTLVEMVASLLNLVNKEWEIKLKHLPQVEKRSSVLKYISAFLIIFLMGISSALAQFGKHWLLCKTDSDCAKVPGVCDRPDSIAKNHIKDYEQFVIKMAKISSCPKLTELQKTENQESVAYCANGQCKLKKTGSL